MAMTKQQEVRTSPSYQGRCQFITAITCGDHSKTQLHEGVRETLAQALDLAIEKGYVLTKDVDEKDE
eukprot:2882635-Rhodomonas_salina.2